MGAHFLAIKDMAGLCRPYAAHKLVKALQGGDRPADSLPHARHERHQRRPRVLQAADAGVDVVDLALASMSGSTRQPNLNSVVAALQHTPRDTELDLDALNECSDYWEHVREFYGRSTLRRTTGTAEVYLHEMPGGQYTNLKEQAAAMGAGAPLAGDRAHLRRREPAVRRHREGHALVEGRW